MLLRQNESSNSGIAREQAANQAKPVCTCSGMSGVDDGGW